jgi:hypothetical protein
MDITLNKASIGMNQLHGHLFALFPARVRDIVVTGGEFGDWVRVYTTEPGGSQPTETEMDATLEGLVNGYMTLPITASKTSLVADGIDETTLTSPGLTTFEYTIWRDGVLDSSGTVSDGVLELSAASAGQYLVEVRDGDDTGYVEVTAE